MFTVVAFTYLSGLFFFFFPLVLPLLLFQFLVLLFSPETSIFHTPVILLLQFLFSDPLTHIKALFYFFFIIHPE